MPMTIFLTIEDPDGDQSVVSLPIEDLAITEGVNIPFIVEGVWDIINPLVNGTLVNAGITVQVNIGDFTNAAAAAIADVQEKAEFVFRAVGEAGNFIKRISLPTFVETFFTGSGSGKEVDVTQSAVTAFTTMIEDGIDDALIDPTPIQFVTDHGEDITTFVKGRQAWGKNRG